MRKEEEEFIRSIFGKEKGAFLGTGRAEMKAFVTEGTKELFLTFRIGAWFWFHLCLSGWFPNDRKGVNMLPWTLVAS
ncbi:MAG: hypothetical protein NG712_03145, partial [Omnitrophica bacterium]|nr:hypothetical protein [Candidatus Omnitrophota bacterium]